jgi:ABC-type Fe3+/spermidine/putrescine transport system ATPase subunit
MAKGRIEQEGSPLEIFDRPATPFVAQFVGETNIVESVVSAPELALWGPFRFTVMGPSVGSRVRIFFRPNDVYLSSTAETLQVEGKITRSRFRGPLIEHHVDVGAERLVIAHVPKGVSLASGFEAGRRVWVGVTAFHVFPSNPNESAGHFAWVWAHVWVHDFLPQPDRS